MRNRLVALFMGFAVCLTGMLPAFAAEKVLIFAAASTSDAISEAAQQFEAETGVKIVPVFAGSGALAKQIAAGAPADIFLSANTRWMDDLEGKGGTAKNSRRNLLSNRLVLITPKDTPPLTIAALPERLGNHRVVMGDPDHVPAGIYGREALESLGIWDSISSRVARMPSVRSALTLVDRGEVAAGIVYATDAPIARNTRIADTFPVTSHPPIVYPIALTIEGAEKQEARTFLQFLTGEKARALFAKYGFSTPPTN